MANKTVVEENIINFIFEGQVTGQELIDTVAGHYASDDWVPGNHVFADMSGAEMGGVTFQDLSQFNNELKRIYLEKKPPKFKVAVYTTNILIFAIGRMYHSISSAFVESPEIFKLFRNKDEALGWLTQS
jgi:hypothetical protein